MDQTKNDFIEELNIEEPIATLKENILPTEQNVSIPVKEDFHNLKCSTFEELRKFNSDSSAFSDYSSENSETVADSDVSSRKNFSSRLRLAVRNNIKIFYNKSEILRHRISQNAHEQKK